MNLPMKRTVLYFTAPGEVETRREQNPPLEAGALAVRTEVSSISPGTEMLIYRGQTPADLPADESLPSLEGNLHYPLKYGYACAGRVVAAGSQKLRSWEGCRVFSFQPHASTFHALPEQLIPIPEDISAERAVFLPNLETAVNLVHDGAPLLGERVVVFGQGIVGLLTTSLLSDFCLDLLITLDIHEHRRQASIDAGAHAALDALAADTSATLRELLDGEPTGADLILELSGVPQVLNQAIETAGFDGRIVVGSWYGTKQAPLDLGGRFHRQRIRIISSQVSTIRPGLSGRWTKSRRLELALKRLSEIQPERWITQRFSIEHAQEAYELIDQHPEQTIQVLFTY
jgi:2-desacetyl-2-hydroxyethyl bacteriochlorophyllide A dehydrogenase